MKSVHPTPREIQIIRLIADGLSSREIADHLSLSEKTVEAHRCNIHRKLQVNNRAQLIHAAVRLNLIDLVAAR